MAPSVEARSPGSSASTLIVLGPPGAAQVTNGQHDWAGVALRHVAPGEIHDVVNREPAPAVSFHAYSPPLRRMTYDGPSGDGLVPVRFEHVVGGERW